MEHGSKNEVKILQSNKKEWMMSSPLSNNCDVISEFNLAATEKYATYLEFISNFGRFIGN